MPIELSLLSLMIDSVEILFVRHAAQKPMIDKFDEE